MINLTSAFKLNRFRKACLLFSALLLILPILAWVSGVDIIDSGIVGWPILALFIVAFGRGFELGSKHSGIMLCVFAAGPALALVLQVVQSGMGDPATFSLHLITSLVGGYLSLLCLRHLRASG